MFDRLKSLVTRRPSAPQRPPAAGGRPQPTDGAFMANVLPGVYATPPPKETAGLLQAANTMPWLYAVAWKAGDAVAAQPWKAMVVRKKGKPVSSRMLRHANYTTRQQLYTKFAQAGELEELESHPLLDLLDAGTPYFPGRQSRALTQVYLDLVGEAYLMKERGSYGLPVRMWPLPSTWITNLPGPEHPFYRISFRGWQGEIPASEILRLVKPNPVNPYERGSGIARSLGDELETYEYASRHTKQVFFNQARPDLIISGKGLANTETQRLESMWTNKLQGFWNVAKPFFISNDVTVTPVSQNFQHLELVKLREHERDMIIQTFGYPPEIFGINAHSNRSTIQEASYIAARYVVLPRLELQREFLQTYLVPEFDDRIILDFVSPVEEDREFQLKVMQSAPFTVNEYRSLAKLDALDGPEGEKFVMPGTVKIADTIEATPEPAPVRPTTPAPKPKPRSSQTLAALVDTIVKEEIAALQNEQRQTEHEHAAAALAARVATLEEQPVAREEPVAPPVINLSLPLSMPAVQVPNIEVAVPQVHVSIPAQPKRVRETILRDPVTLEIVQVVRETIEDE